MKNNNKLVIIVMIITLGVVSFISCEKEHQELAIPTNTNDFSIVGKVHNEILKSYYEQQSQRTVLKFVQDFLVKEKGVEIKKIKSISLKLFKNDKYGLISGKKSVTSIENIHDYIFAISDIYNVSDELLQRMELAFYVADTSGIDNLRTFINTNIKSFNYLSEDDELIANIFLDVFENSAEYWTNNSTSNKTLKLKDSSKVIIADAIGALHGSIFGPIGSIIEGAVVSVITNEEL